MTENSLTLKTLDGRTAYEPGEEITVDAAWQFDAPQTSIELRLVWFTQGKGDSDIQVVEKFVVPTPRPNDAQRWTVRLPDSPYSFSGKLITLTWAVEFVAGPEHSQRIDIVVAPAGREVLLQKQAAT